MIDLTVDETGDLAALVNADLQLVEGADQVAQRLRIRLRLIQGEWFMDVNAGLPWFTEILGKHIDLDPIEAMLRREILAAIGVLEITAFDLTHDRAQRTLRLAFTVSTAEGVAGFEGSVP